MTAETRHRDPPFEVLRFTATHVSADLVVLELDGRVGARARFGRRPPLVVEDAGGRRTELSPLHTALRDGGWQSTYALAATAAEHARYALAVPGALLELPAPDVREAGDRAAWLAREANALRRALEAAERRALAAQEQAGREEERARAEAAAAEASRRELADERSRSEQTISELRGQLTAVEGKRRALRRQLRAARAEAEGLRRAARPLPHPVQTTPSGGPPAEQTPGGPAPGTPNGPVRETSDSSVGEPVRVLGRPRPRPDVLDAEIARHNEAAMWANATTGPARSQRSVVGRSVAFGALLLFVFVLAALLFGYWI